MKKNTFARKAVKEVVVLSDYEDDGDEASDKEAKKI